MYEFIPVSDRMMTLRNRIRDRVIEIDAESALLMTEADKAAGPMLPYLKHAKHMRAILEGKTVRIEDEEMLVGNMGKNFCGAVVNPVWEGAGMGYRNVVAGNWKLREDGYYHNSGDTGCYLKIHPDEVEKFKGVAEYWQGKTLNDIIMASAYPESYKEVCRTGGSPCGDAMPIIMLPAGHLTPGYPKIVHGGFGAILDEAKQWLKDNDLNLMGENTDRFMFYNAVVDVCEGIINVINRYGDEAERKASECTDEARKAELLDMAESLHWISRGPARTYREACQLALFYAQFLFTEDQRDIGSMGRFDQYSWPLLKKDLEEGRLTEEQAQEITDCFFLKINMFYGGGDGPMGQITGIGNTYLHTTIGGVDPDTGEDATNLVSYMTLASMARMQLHDPTISLRVNKNTPDEMWETAIEVNRIVGGLPLFQNDEEIIPGIIRELGFELRDARDYAIIGCQEITGQGTDYACANGVIPPNTNLHYSALLTMAINDGCNPFNNEQSSLHTGFLYEMTDIEQVKQAWFDMSLYVLKAVMGMNNYCEYIIQHYHPHTILSLSMTGCMETGTDCTWGGCKYNEYGGTATGLATVADSLSAIKYMCFDNDFCTTRELYDACMANWVGYEELQSKIINDAPHFGNADPEADAMMDYVTDAYYRMCQQIYSKRAKIFKAGLYGASDHVAQGYVTWGTPDGRVHPDPIADGASPCQGRDHNGPTSVLSSALGYRHTKFMDGMALNIRIHPSCISNQEGIEKLRDMTKAYLDNGGMEVQYNVVSSDTMRAAQADPDAYHNLVVRIAGYSAYFVELSFDQQNDLISRTENVF